MATYRGSPFEAGVGPAEDDVVLFAACPPPEELGFEPATGHWRKQLRLHDVQALWESRPVGTFRGERCVVLDDLGDRLHIGFLGHDGYLAERLGYWQVDRGVYELVASRAEVSDIFEERTEYPRLNAPASGPDGMRGTPRPGGLRQPGSPQDQARYLPPADSHDQAASYLPSGPGYGGPGTYSALDTAGLDRSAPAPAPAPVPAPAPASTVSHSGPIGYQLGSDRLSGSHQLSPDHRSGVTLPSPAEAPLPLEAAALRAATASRQPRQTAAQRRAAADLLSPADAAAPAEPASAPDAPVSPPPASAAATSPAPAPAPAPAPTARPRRSARRRLATERLFAELAGLASIPAHSYAVGEEVDGAMCLLQTEDGFEVFHSANGNRHELQYFSSEEAACFYLFGVLAAEAVRNGSLLPAAAQLPSAR